MGCDPQFGDARLPERFWEKAIAVDTGCWIWTASTRGAGYPQIRVDGKSVRAHRFAYIKLVDDPGDLDCDHLCREKLCVNPAHIEPVTRAVNLARAMPFRKKKTHCKNGHPYSGENLFYKGNQQNCRQCYRDWNRAYYHRRKN